MAAQHVVTQKSPAPGPTVAAMPTGTGGTATAKKTRKPRDPNAPRKPKGPSLSWNPKRDAALVTLIRRGITTASGLVAALQALPLFAADRDAVTPQKIKVRVAKMIEAGVSLPNLARTRYELDVDGLNAIPVEVDGGTGADTGSQESGTPAGVTG